MVSHHAVPSDPCLNARPGGLRLGLALLFCLPGLALAAVPGLPQQLGGLNSPFVLPPDIPGLFLVALLLGFFAGSVAAAAGPAGAFLLVPGLMGLGMRGATAVGSELLALSLYGLLGGLDHFRAGKLHGKLALCLALGSIPGAAAGAWYGLGLFLRDPGRSDLLISGVQAVLLALLAGFAARDLSRTLRGAEARKVVKAEDDDLRGRTHRDEPRGERRDGRPGKGKEEQGGGARPEKLEAGLRVISGLLAVLRDRSDPSKGVVSAAVPLALGLVSGFLLGLAGSGGGVLVLPVLAKVLGLALIPAVGADLLQTGLAAGLGAVFLSSGGLLSYTTATALLIGLLSGMRLSAPVLRFINPAQIKGFFLAVVAALLLNRLLSLPQLLTAAGRPVLTGLQPALDLAAGFLVFMVPLAFALWVVIALFSNLRELRHGAGLHGILPKALGFSALFTCLALGLLAGLATLPVRSGKDLLSAVDGVLVSRLKERGMDMSALVARLGVLDDELRLTLSFRDERQANSAAELIAAYGFNVAPARNQVQVPYLDLESFARQAVRDGEAFYRGGGRPLALNSGLPERETLLLLWSLVGTFQAEEQRRGRTEQAAVLGSIRAEVLEPAYNLSGVPLRAGMPGWVWFAVGSAALLAVGLLWRLGGNLLLTGLGVTFLRDPVPLTPPAEPAAEAPRPKPAPAPAAKPKKAKETASAPAGEAASPAADSPPASSAETRAAAPPTARAPEKAPTMSPQAPTAKAQAKPSAQVVAQPQTGARPAQARPAAKKPAQ